MRTGTSGAASLRHVGLVALEALMVAAVVWVAAMTLAGATQAGDGIAGAANAGRESASVSIPDTRLGTTVVATVRPGAAGSWVHVSCTRDAATVLSQWVAVDAAREATLVFARSDRWAAGSASCTGEEGYFQANGRWRVMAVTRFAVRG